jgi:hypothetical protein
MNATRTRVELPTYFTAPQDTQEFDGRFLCGREHPAFVAYEVRGRSEFAALNTKRTVVPIHCE